MFKIKPARWRGEASSDDSTCHELIIPSLTSENLSPKSTMDLEGILFG